MGLKDLYLNKKRQLEEKKLKQKELEEKAKYDVEAWYEAYGDNFEAAGLAFVMPDKYEILTDKSSYKHTAAARVLFSKYYDKDLDQEEKTNDLGWISLFPEKYNTICVEFFSIYKSQTVFISMPDEINDFQMQKLYDIENEIKKFNEKEKNNLKILNYRAVKASDYESEDEFDTIDDMLNAFYNKENERSEQHGKV